jgi:antigen flippase
LWLGLAWACVHAFGLTGAGIAFFGSYIFHTVITYPIAHRLSGFRWSSENRTTVLILGSLTAAVFGGFYLLPPALAVCAGTLALALSCVYSIRILATLVSLNHLPAPLRRVAVRLGVVPGD